MSVSRALVLALQDPALFARKSVARLSRRLPFFPRRPVRRIGGVRFECDMALDPRVADMYFAAYEPDEVAVLARFLKPGDTFLDIGANIGYLTAIGASLVGPGGAVHGFEPVPEYFARLDALRAANPGFPIHAWPFALGETEGTAEIATPVEHNIGWNTMVPGLLTGAAARARHTVPVHRLDAFLGERAIANVALIKIDTEGFEIPVLRGARGFFETARPLPPILCEVAPATYSFMGFRLADLYEYLAGFGYGVREIGPRGRRVAPGEIQGTTNLLFVADA
jgi:FkbM family methyltransferase